MRGMRLCFGFCLAAGGERESRAPSATEQEMAGGVGDKSPAADLEGNATVTECLLSDSLVCHGSPGRSWNAVEKQEAARRGRPWGIMAQRLCW